MSRRWNVLVVDDDDDVHEVTELALKRKSYRGRQFRLLHAASAREARAVLEGPEGSTIHVALVDVVMESDNAGLELCEFIRKQMPTSLRIILRTGQPGVAPEETVMNDYDVDTYLAKANLTNDLLYTALRAACRSSFDVATATLMADQLRDYIEALQLATTGSPALTQIMLRGLDFVEAMHDVQLAFVDFADQEPRHGFDVGLLRRALSEATKRGAGPVVGGDSCGLSSHELLLLIPDLQIAPPPKTKQPDSKQGDSALDRVARWLRRPGSEERPVQSVTAAIYIRPVGSSLRPKQQSDLVRDLNRFMEGWRVAMAMLAMRERIVNERMVAIDLATQSLA